MVIFSQSVGSTFGAALRHRMGGGVMTGLDQGAGAAFGFVRGLFLVWLLAGLLVLLPMPTLATEARESTILRALQTRLPSPLVMAAELGQAFEATGLPDVFVGAPPPADTPDVGVSDAQAAEIASGARGSTMRVETVACGSFVSGTAFAVSPDHLVTNAHVVAGATDVFVSFDGGFERHRAQVVMFNPQLDAALLVVSDQLDLAPLTLTGSRPQRSAPAAAIGFTGGGGERIIPAVISRSLAALGRDIYGNDIVARNVIEVREDVRPGDSGGPLVLADGSIGGVTFSESRQNPNIGYALSANDVANAIEPALSSASAVDTGECITEAR